LVLVESSHLVPDYEHRRISSKGQRSTVEDRPEWKRKTYSLDYDCSSLKSTLVHLNSSVVC
jgi:hypothetical protein